MKKNKTKIIIIILIFLCIIILIGINKMNRRNITKTTDLHTQKITKEDFLETFKEECGLSSEQAEIELEKSYLENENLYIENFKPESQYYEMVDKILLTEENSLVGVIRVQVFVDSDDNLLGFGKVIMKDLLVEGAKLYHNEDYGTEKDFETAIRKPEETLINVEILGGVQFYTEKKLKSEKIETLGEYAGQNLYRYIVDDMFAYSLIELEKEN